MVVRGVRVLFAAVLGTLALGGALGAGCDTVDCGAGTHAESGACVADVTACPCGPGTTAQATDAGCTCVADVPADCTCGPGTTRVSGDGGCECAALPPLLGAVTCTCGVRPVASCNVANPAPCVAPADAPARVLATTFDDAGSHFLVGGDGVAARAGGGAPEILELQHPFSLDGQPARVPLAVATDGSFATDPGGQVFTWDLLFLPDQPPLPLHGVSVTGTLDWSGRIAQGGRISGCFALADAQAIYLEVLSQTLAEMTVGSGAVPDCDATGGGDVDGYTLELLWTAGETATVVE